VLAARPVAYWRLNEASGRLAANAVAGGVAARVRDGAAWYLPGPGSGSGIGAGEALTPSAFSGPRQINRALHVAGGDLQAEFPNLGERYTIALWFWLGEASGASERSGTLVVGPKGETLVARQNERHEVRLELGGAMSAVLVREGAAVRVHLDGRSEPDLAAPAPARAGGAALVFGQGLQGKLDEIAVFPRALLPAETTGFWEQAKLRR
jgi:hypothetical protein